MAQGEELFGITFEKGEVIFCQDDPGDTMYIIQSGVIEISRSQSGKKEVLALLEQGSLFGEMALVDKHPRSATAISITRSRLLAFTRSSLMERISHDPGVVIHLLKILSQRISETNDRVRKMIQGNEFLRTQLQSKPASIDSLPMGKHHNKRTTEHTTTSPGSSFTRASAPEYTAASSPEFSFDVDAGQRFKPNDSIFRQGEDGHSMFIILEGEVVISQGADGNQQMLAHLGSGDFFGEMSIITHQPRTAHATALTQTALLPIHQEDFLERMRAEPELALYILEGLIRRLRTMLLALASPEKTIDTVRQSILPPLRKKSRIKTALVSLATCGGCSAILLERQELLIQLLEKIKISYCPMLIDKEEIGEVEVAIVDGVVRVKEDEEKLIEAREKSKYLIAWGTCASYGGIPSFANHYELEDLIDTSYGQAQDPFAYYLSGSLSTDMTTYQEHEQELKLLRRAGKVNDFVKIDYYLPGCPPRVQLLMQLVNELRGDGQTAKPKPIVCAECSRKPVKIPIEHFWVSPKPDWNSEHCFTSKGALCMGFLTKGGCGAVCPQGGLPCWGCRGPSETAFKKIYEGNTFEEYMMNGLLNRHRNMESEIKLVMKIFRKQGASSLKFNRFFISDLSRVR